MEYSDKFRIDQAVGTTHSLMIFAQLTISPLTEKLDRPECLKSDFLDEGSTTETRML